MDNILIRNYLNENKFTTRAELVIRTGLSDRKVRDKISKLKKEEPILSNSQNKGYKLAKSVKNLKTKEDIKRELSLVNICINEAEARITDLSKSTKIYKKYKNELEIFLEEIDDEEK